MTGKGGPGQGKEMRKNDDEARGVGPLHMITI